MSDLDDKVKAWMESLGYEFTDTTIDGFEMDDSWFEKISPVTPNHVDWTTAKQLYLNPPLDSPAVKRAVLEARIEEHKDVAEAWKWSAANYIMQIQKKYWPIGHIHDGIEDPKHYFADSERLRELEQQLKELEEENGR
jgi:hypothetical protein